jgi:hypothetical protein
VGPLELVLTSRPAAMLAMKKIDLAAIEAAADNA